MSQEIEPKNELMCPITMDYLEDPISLPCCGRGISRMSLVACLEENQHCPLCKADLSHTDPMAMPKSINLAYMVEDAKKSGVPIELFQPPPKPQSTWKAVINKLCNNDSVYQTVIGQLEISNTDNSFNFKTLLIPVIDESGSMAGSPNKQVKYSLHRMVDLTYKYPQILTNMIGYSDNAISFAIDKSLPQAYHRDSVERIGRGGGTSFRSAFDEIIKVCDKYKTNQDITSIVIIFLTDGEDSSVGKSQRGELVTTLKTNIGKVWNKQFVTHAIGFGGSHDFDFLNNLRLIGTSEGAYRYADPSEDSDSLSNKINSLLDVIAMSSAIPLDVVQIDNSPKILSGENGKYWIDLTGFDLTKNYEFAVSVNNADPIMITSEYAEDENDSKIWEQWYSFLIDQIASELLMLTGSPDSLDKQIHCELLQQRSRAIGVRIDSTSANAERLEKLTESLKIIQKGGNVSQQKLNDMKFEGKYATKGATSTPQPAITYPTQSNFPQYTVPKFRTWDTIARPRMNMRDSQYDVQIFSVIRDYSYTSGADWISSNLQSHLNVKDNNGSNALIFASCLGNYDVVKAIMESNCISINETNNLGFNPLDMAVLYGFWITSSILIEHGAKPSQNSETLLMTCISRGYYKTAELLIKNRLVNVTEGIADAAPTTEASMWLRARTGNEITIETAITKGLFDIIEEKLHTITEISWKPYLNIFAKPLSDHYRIVELLIKNKKADPNEIINISIESQTDGQMEKEITWPLFVACEKGQTSMFKLLMKYVDLNNLNMQNLKGTSLLWIASCNRHIDIVMELINYGVNPNMANLKGDSPLIPAISKGADGIVQLLLEAGASQETYNKNRDGPVLIACRNGQAKILEILLKRLDEDGVKSILNQAADIDGFPPLHASTELDKTECIKVCLKFGADIEARSADDNQVIAGATSLQLACYYNKIASVKTLIDLGASIISKTTVSGQTPLHIALKQNHGDVIRYLLSLPQGRECLEIIDNDGRKPIYYARNQEIFEEFFTNKLALMLNKVIMSDSDTEARCSHILSKFGRSFGCYEFKEITEIDLGSGSTVLSHALLNGNKHLINSLGQMGANLNKPDDYGITPAFWAKYLGFDMPNSQIDKHTFDLLDAIEHVRKNSIQNKMLLNMSAGIPKLIESSQNAMTPLLKMKDGYNSKVNDGVLTTLRNSLGLDHILFGFVDKLKNEKVFPDGKQCLEYIIWDSKVHLIKLVASGEINLQPIHMLALYLYTSNPIIFQQVNYALTFWKDSNIWNPFVFCLYQAINLIPPYIGEVYRGIDVPFNSIDYAIGNTIKWKTFSICSKDYTSSTELINQKKGMIFVIKSLSGKLISRYAKNPIDNEVIFKPNSEFRITNHFIASLTCLGQANIRTSTFKVKEKDLIKATNGESCIIIELEEIDNIINLI